MGWLKRPLKIIRKCKCGNKYHKDDAKRIDTGKLNIKFYRDYSGKLRMSTENTYRECCEECFEKHKVEKDLKHGITSEMRKKAEEHKRRKVELWSKVRIMIDDWKKRGD